MQGIIADVCGYTKNEPPTHLLGIEGVSDISNGIKDGINTFDLRPSHTLCPLP
jgi:queuine/archaeosine tRNA-ribosyltransferase